MYQFNFNDINASNNNYHFKGKNEFSGAGQVHVNFKGQNTLTVRMVS